MTAFIAHAKANPGQAQLRDHRRRLGAGDLRAPARAARRHLDEPHPVPHRPADHAGPDRGTRAHLRLADAGGAAAAQREAAQGARRFRAPSGSRARRTSRRSPRARCRSCASAGSASAPARERRSRSSPSSTATSPRSSRSPEYRALIEKSGSIADVVDAEAELGTGDRADPRRGRLDHPGIRNAAGLTSPINDIKRERQTGGTTMTIKHALTRRQYLAATGASALALGLGARAGVRPDGDHPSGLPDQHLGHADLLPLEVGRAREARPEIPGIRGRRPAISPCSRWWAARSTSAPMPASRS